ncbi:MAG: GNAT family N-acetyltransferase [Thermomicrobiales bacterium]|nr:GNAT family N-acetyltransferase [Thermomicrobiales bacterium]
MTGSSPLSNAERHAFLVNETVYLRPVELADAACLASWSQSLFPVPREVAEEQLRQRLEELDPDELHANMLLIICRCDNDDVVGSVEISTVGWRFGQVVPSIDRLAAPDAHDLFESEVIGMLVPWMLGERHLMTVTIESSEPGPRVESLVQELGGRVSVIHREALMSHSRRRSRIEFQFFDPFWMEKFGRPDDPVFGVAATVEHPAAPTGCAGLDDCPESAVIMGERVYLRTSSPDTPPSTAVQLAPAFDTHGYGHIPSRYGTDRAPGSVGFFIALRETGAIIASCEISAISWTHLHAHIRSRPYDPAYWEDGIDVEAEHLLLGYAFDQLGLHMVYANTTEKSDRTSTLQRTGYRPAGTIGWDSFCGDSLCDLSSFDMLASEWRSARG